MCSNASGKHSANLHVHEGRRTLHIHNWWNTYLGPRVRFYLRELEFRVVGIHLAYLFPGWSPKNLDDLDQLIYSTVSREDGLRQQHFSQYTPCGPDIYKTQPTVFLLKTVVVRWWVFSKPFSALHHFNRFATPQVSGENQRQKVEATKCPWDTNYRCHPKSMNMAMTIKRSALPAVDQWRVEFPHMAFRRTYLSDKYNL